MAIEQEPLEHPHPPKPPGFTVAAHAASRPGQTVHLWSGVPRTDTDSLSEAVRPEAEALLKAIGRHAEERGIVLGRDDALRIIAAEAVRKAGSAR